MTVIAAVIKNGQVCIAGDTQTNFGALKVNQKYMVDHKKIFQINDSVIGIVGWSATAQIFEYLLSTKPEIFKLNSRWEIFEVLLKLQEELKDTYFIETSEDSEQPVESNQIDALIINQNGIFQVGSYREVHEFSKFWALGSGKRLALGAMHALYETAASAQEIAEAGVKAAAEFDDGCNLPITTVKLDMKEQKD